MEVASPELGPLSPTAQLWGMQPSLGQSSPPQSRSTPPVLHTSLCRWSSPPGPRLPTWGQCGSGATSTQQQGLASLGLRQRKSPLKANQAQAATALAGMAGDRSQQLCCLLPASFPRPGNGAGLKAPGSHTAHPQPQLWTLHAATEVLQPTAGSQPQATVWDRRSPESAYPWGNIPGLLCSLLS